MAESIALLIGVDEYRHLSPLRYAGADTQALADVLVECCGFKPSNVAVLSDRAPGADDDPTRAHPDFYGYLDPLVFVESHRP